MVRTLGMEINDPGMANTAKVLMYAHVCIAICGFLICVMSIVSHFLIESAKNEMYEASGNDYVTEVGFSNTEEVFIPSLLNVIVPLFLAACVYSGIKNNNQGMMQGMCFVTSCCSCCACLGVFTFVVAILGISALKKEADDFQCTAYHASNCQEVFESVSGFLPTLFGILVVELILNVCELGGCVLAAVKSNNAQDSLRKGLVFTGVPVNPPQGGMVIGQPVVGQPVGAPNQMKQS